MNENEWLPIYLWSWEDLSSYELKSRGHKFDNQIKKQTNKYVNKREQRQTKTPPYRKVKDKWYPEKTLL